MKSDWKDIAELIGIAAIVASLVFVGLELRQTQSELRLQTRQSWVENYNVWRQMVLEPGNSDIWIRGLNDLDDLTRDERVKFNKIAGSVAWSGWFMYLSIRSEGAAPTANDRAFRDMFLHPGLNEFMKFQRVTHADEFGDFLDEVRESVGSERVGPGEPTSYTEGFY